MGFPPLLSFFVFLVLFHGGAAIGREMVSGDESARFDQNYEVSWGFDHFMALDQGKEIQLSLDISSGAGIESKQSYGSGFIEMRIKLPEKDSAGVVTAFYLHSHTDKHDELDFEFLGNREGKPYTLQTNVFANGDGNREQRFHLWFDPTSDFHTYQLLWNPHQIVPLDFESDGPRSGSIVVFWAKKFLRISVQHVLGFFVDDVPIRVAKNLTRLGVGYPRQAMRIEASIWDGDDWATDGGQTKTNWSHAPFKAQFQKFDINGCPLPQSFSHRLRLPPCDSSNHWWWNAKKYWKLDATQQEAYENVRNKYMNYDYCGDRTRHPTPPLECSYQ